MNATYRNIQRLGRAKYGDVSDHKLEKLLTAEANIPKRSLNNFQRNEPPQEHHYLYAIAKTLGIPKDMLTQGSLNNNPVTALHKPRHHRHKYAGLRKLIVRSRNQFGGISTNELADKAEISHSAMDTMLRRELSNAENVTKLLTLMQLPMTYFDNNPSEKAPVAASQKPKQERHWRKTYFGLSKLIAETKETLNMTSSQLALATGITTDALRKMERDQLSNQPNLEKFLTAINLPVNYLDPKVRAARAQNKKNGGVFPAATIVKASTPPVAFPSSPVVYDSEMTVEEARDNIIKNFIMTINNNQISGEQTIHMLTDDAEVIAREILVARGVNPDIILAGKAFAQAFSR